MIVLVLLLVLICIWIFYRYKVAGALLDKWLSDNNFKLIKKKQRFLYVIDEVRYSPYRQFLYEIEIETEDSELKKAAIIIGNWFWGLLKKEVKVIWF